MVNKPKTAAEMVSDLETMSTASVTYTDGARIYMNIQIILKGSSVT